MNWNLGQSIIQETKRKFEMNCIQVLNSSRVKANNNCLWRPIFELIIRNETIGKQNDRAHLCGNFQARDSSKDDAALMDITKWIVDCRSCNCVCCAVFTQIAF